MGLRKIICIFMCSVLWLYAAVKQVLGLEVVTFENPPVFRLVHLQQNVLCKKKKVFFKKTRSSWTESKGRWSVFIILALHRRP